MWPGHPRQNQQQRLQQQHHVVYTADDYGATGAAYESPGWGMGPPQQHQPGPSLGPRLQEANTYQHHQAQGPLAGPSFSQYRSSAPPGQGQSLGWGGQSLPPGRYEGDKGHGRGRRNGGSSFHMRGRGRGRRGGPGGRGLATEESDAIIADIVLKVRQLAPGTTVQDVAAKGLAQLDSRSAAVLVKQLAKSNLAKQAWELFHWLRQLEEGHPLKRLCDVYLYTAMISLCTNTQEMQLAMELSQEMAQKAIERNVHTFSALMNVCIKAGQNQPALEVYRDMQEAGCQPNLVTYNTLIDVYGKTGQWAEAMRVLAKMRAEGVEPVTRTYNTLMIACNTSNQWQEALQVYHQMLDAGLQPNTTTYNALISSYSKAGRLEKVMEAYQEMVAAGCERSVITYSSLISACEKAGQWELASQFFQRMHQEGCKPNTITYNSLITAFAQGGQWERASEQFEQMQRQGCRPDVVTYTALISAYERGGQWRRSLQAFEQMQRQGCEPDPIIYSAIIEALWETGIKSVQEKAVALYRTASADGHVRHPAITSGEFIEASLNSTSSNIAVIMLCCWLADLKDKVLQDGSESLPEKVLVRFGKGRQRDVGSNTTARNGILALLQLHRSPFKLSQDSTSNSSRLEAAGNLVGEWLSDVHVLQLLDMYSAASCFKLQSSTSNDFTQEVAMEIRCNEAFATVKLFEQTHCLNVRTMGQNYIAARRELIPTLFKVAESLGIADELSHDAVLLMDRVMSTPIQIREDLYLMAMVASLLVVIKHILPVTQQPTDEDVTRVTGLSMTGLRATEATIRGALVQDTASISALRSLKLYLSYLGHQVSGPAQEVSWTPLLLLNQAVCDPEFLNYRPSATAAGILYADRLRCGQLPPWPTTLANMTGYNEFSSPEMSAAINGAQRLVKQQ